MNEKLSLKELFWISATILLGILIYGRSFSNGFVWDDHFYVWKNPLILSWRGLKAIWIDPKIGEYYPITNSILWLEHKLWGVHPWGYHVTSLMIHTGNTLLLFALLRKSTPRLAGLFAVLFMIHPIQVETVAWISEQKTLLCCFFLLLAFHTFFDFDASRQKRDYLKTLLFFTAALLSKSIAICFAFVPLLYGWWKRDSLRKRDLLVALPLLLTGGMIAILHLHLIDIHDSPMHIPASSLSVSHRILLAGRIFFFYIEKILFPRSFMTIYPKWPMDETPIIDWIYPTGAILLFLILFWKRRSLGRGFFAILCFYTLSIFPVLGLIDFAWYRFSYVADHFAYLAVPSVLLLAGLSLSRFFSMLRNHWPLLSWPPSPHLKKILSALSALLIVHLSIFSSRLSLNYRNDVVLWTQALRQNPSSPFPYLHLAEICSSTPGCKTDEAIALFQKSIRLKPDYLHSHMSLAACYKKKRDYEKALTTYQHAAELARPFTKMLCYRFISDILLDQSRFDEALPYLEKAIELGSNAEHQWERQPQMEAAIRSDLGALYLMREENHKAARLFREAITLNSQQSNSHAGLGAALMNLGDHKNAAQAFQKASDLDPANASLKDNLNEAQRRLQSLPT